LQSISIYPKLSNEAIGTAFMPMQQSQQQVFSGDTVTLQTASNLVGGVVNMGRFDAIVTIPNTFLWRTFYLFFVYFLSGFLGIESTIA